MKLTNLEISNNYYEANKNNYNHIFTNLHVEFMPCWESQEPPDTGYGSQNACCGGLGLTVRIGISSYQILRSGDEDILLSYIRIDAEVSVFPDADADEIKLEGTGSTPKVDRLRCANRRVHHQWREVIRPSRTSVWQDHIKEVGDDYVKIALEQQ
ncbi:hypothetical protein P154DRAFT_537114 [Amniculicola lignicola CBS 123094]|uniref:Uncharacterized protein n=1 Tax=Amniculicola lignicola CBS 123094 TaxID=1392246 RepID=A0A6A5WBA3_9PLEO|nr:hypothetical protein P154DRAFT_537114 [Amniculicola lignicola CBS 123094]